MQRRQNYDELIDVIASYRYSLLHAPVASPVSDSSTASSIEKAMNQLAVVFRKKIMS